MADKVGHNLFCKQCGIRTYGRGYVEEIGGDYVAVNLAVLDNLYSRKLVGAPIRYLDGRNNNWQSEPEITARLCSCLPGNRSSFY